MAKRRQRLILVGDSDIAYWPKKLLPSVIIPIDDCDEVFLENKNGNNNNNNNNKHNHKRQQEKLKQIARPNKISVTVSGHSGATLAGILPHLRSILSDSSSIISSNDNDDDDSDKDNINDIKSSRINQNCDSGETKAAATTSIIVACAGENDISQGLSLERSIEQLREFLDLVFLDDDDGNDNNNDNNNRNNNNDDNRFLIFLGPKFEPWQDNHHDNISYKKKYNSMTRAFQRCLQEYKKKKNGNDNDDENNSNDFSRRIHYIDCLTMFCDEETTNLPGARFCGRAKAEPYYFSSDQLHLSDSGYYIWKDIIETKILQCLTPSSLS
jgi:hypothetical protein